MDEAVGALQRVRGSANHSAVMEMVMILKASYLNRHIQQQQQEKLQQLQCTMQYNHVCLCC